MRWLFGGKNTKAKEDPIGDICKSLVERWYEWSYGKTLDTNNPGLMHKSRVSVVWTGNGTTVYIGWNDAIANSSHSPYDDLRLMVAIRGNLAARLRPRDNFDDVAKSLAHAVLAGDTTAMRALKDRLDELQSQGIL